MNAKVKEQNQDNKTQKIFPEGHSAVALPDSIPNSEVKCCYADGSVVIRYVRVGHFQGYLIKRKREKPFDSKYRTAFLYLSIFTTFEKVQMVI